MFPFVLKVIVRPAAGKSPIINNETSQILFEGTVEKVEEHKTSCRKIGLSTAHRFMNGVDLDLQCLTLLWSHCSLIYGHQYWGLYTLWFSRVDNVKARRAQVQPESSHRISTVKAPMVLQYTLNHQLWCEEDWITDSKRIIRIRVWRRNVNNNMCASANWRWSSFLRIDSQRWKPIRPFSSQINNCFCYRRIREKRKALSTGKQLWKVNKTAKRTGCENSLLAPITKWRTTVPANEKNIG